MNPHILILAVAALFAAVTYAGTAWALSEGEIIRLHAPRSRRLRSSRCGDP